MLWSKGKTKDNHPSIRQGSEKLRIPDSEIFIENSKYIGGTKLRPRLLELGFPNRCFICGINT